MRTCASLCGPTTISQHPSSPNPHSPTPQRFSIVSNADQALLRPDAIRPSSEPHEPARPSIIVVGDPRPSGHNRSEDPMQHSGEGVALQAHWVLPSLSPFEEGQPKHLALNLLIRPHRTTFNRCITNSRRSGDAFPLSSPSPFFSDANKGPRCAPERTRNTSSAGRPTL
jgi:hypothetical protein